MCKINDLKTLQYRECKQIKMKTSSRHTTVQIHARNGTHAHNRHVLKKSSMQENNDGDVRERDGRGENHQLILKRVNVKMAHKSMPSTFFRCFLSSTFSSRILCHFLCDRLLLTLPLKFDKYAHLRHTHIHILTAFDCILFLLAWTATAVTRIPDAFCKAVYHRSERSCTACIM